MAAAAAWLVSALPATAQETPDYLSWANPGPYLSG